MTTQNATMPDLPNVPRTANALPAIPSEIRRAVLQLLGPQTLTTRRLHSPWPTSTAFAIAKFSDPSFEWVRKCLHEQDAGRRSVLLLDVRPETVGGQLVLRRATSILFVTGKQIAGRATMLAGFGVDLTPLAWLGVAVRHYQGEQ